MSYTLYSCENPGEIIQTSTDEYLYPIIPSQFCIVYKYDSLYNRILPRFNNVKDTPYALPAERKPIRLYNGIDREPCDNTPCDFDRYSHEDAKLYYRLLLETKDAKDIELIFIRIDGCSNKIPEGMTFLGYDIAYPFTCEYSDGFSIICDCMFLCRWHGCDASGTEFVDDFALLNDNGLFDRKEEACNYLYHYLNQDFAETGDYLIYEIYK